MERLIVADPHLGQRPGDVAAMAGLLEAVRRGGVREVIYLGDVCQYLIGMPKFWTTQVRELLALWDDLRAEGIRVGIVEGNRDFFLGEPELEAHLDWWGRSHEFESGGTRYRLVHGDLVNRKDRMYRFWSALAKSRPAHFWARLLPDGLAVGIVRQMEARLAKTNRRFRYRKPVDDLVREARQAWNTGVDVLLWGHFHTPWRCDEDGHTALVVPAWLEFGLTVLVDGKGWRLVENTLTPPERLPRMERCPRKSI